MNNELTWNQILMPIQAAILHRDPAKQVGKRGCQSIGYALYDAEVAKGEMIVEVNTVRKGENGEISVYEIWLRGVPGVSAKTEEGKILTLRTPVLQDHQIDAFRAEVERLSDGRWGFPVALDSRRWQPKPGDIQVIQLRHIFLYHPDDQLPVHSIARLLEFGEARLLAKHADLVALSHFGQVTIPPIG